MTSEQMRQLRKEHLQVTRRFFSGLGVPGMTAWIASYANTKGAVPDPLLEKAISELEYLTPLSAVKPDGRGNPPPNKFSAEQRRAACLTPDTWYLEVVPDAASTPAPELARPLTKAHGTAIDLPALRKLGDRHAVRYMHVCTCTNVPDPFHMCLWEGVPLREILWMAGLKRNVRRVYYWGPESEDFHSSLPLDRILEEAPGELPVILAFKMNGQEIPGPLGGPVRLIAPGFYANRSMKWIRHMVLTNDFRANDSYAEGNNDVESRLKTYARFLKLPSEVPALKPCAITGLAQVGISGLSRVQYCVFPGSQHRLADDPFLTNADWHPATILPPPTVWGGGVTANPDAPLQLNPATGRPRTWPMRYAIAHWAAVLPALPPGKYTLCCRTLDANGIAQPMPRPLPQTGANAIQHVPLLALAA
jgi:DMSO/TMAO reductase YedYZ molybdopterin-dependent catalytic subunit